MLCYNTNTMLLEKYLHVISSFRVVVRIISEKIPEWASSRTHTPMDGEDIPQYLINEMSKTSQERRWRAGIRRDYGYDLVYG